MARKPKSPLEDPRNHPDNRPIDPRDPPFDRSDEDEQTEEFIDLDDVDIEEDEDEDDEDEDEEVDPDAENDRGY